MKAPRHDNAGLRGLAPSYQAEHVARNLLRAETASYLCYEMLCHQNKVEPLGLDEFLKRAEDRDALWRSQCALEDMKEEAELKKARELTRELAPKFMLDQILHHLSILNHDGTIIKDLSKLSCPTHGPKDWEKWCHDQYVDSNAPTYDKDKLRKHFETLFKDTPSDEHGQLYCWKEADVPVLNPKGPQFPRFPPTEKGPCMTQLTSNYWRFIRK